MVLLILRIKLYVDRCIVARVVVDGPLTNTPLEALTIAVLLVGQLLPLVYRRDLEVGRLVAPVVACSLLMGLLVDRAVAQLLELSIWLDFAMIGCPSGSLFEAGVIAIEGLLELVLRLVTSREHVWLLIGARDWPTVLLHVLPVVALVVMLCHLMKNYYNRII